MANSLSKSERTRIWNRLKTVAMSDGTLTEEEQELMANALIDVEQYNVLIQKAKKDGIIDQTEGRQLFEGRMKIMEKAYDKARSDNVITSDEQAILKEICRIIRELD